jgi:outer membrane protein insertion porin family
MVNKVEIQGNERISSETIMIFGDILIGKDYDTSDISLLIKKLYETTFFSNISVELKNNNLTLIVKENPIINEVIFKGEKAKKFKEKIRELIVLKEKNSYVGGNLKADINLIKT